MPPSRKGAIFPEQQVKVVPQTPAKDGEVHHVDLWVAFGVRPSNGLPISGEGRR